jgi:hypothetical protein
MKIVGTIKVDCDFYDGKNSMNYPVGPINEPEKGSLSATDMIQSDAKEIADLAAVLCADCNSAWCVVKRANRFVADSIKISDKIVSAKTAYLTKKGDTISKARLCAAILRASGIPAEIVGGLVLSNGLWATHHWVRVWPGEKIGWVQIDPTTGEDKTFSASHILLWQGESGLESSRENSVHINSFKYIEENYKAKGLKWRTGAY